MRFDPWVLGLLLLACGSGSSGSGGAVAASDGAEDGSEASTALRFAVEGRGESGKLSTVLDVVEGEEASRLTITGSDAAENLISIYALLYGTDTVVGSHVVPIGPLDTDAFAVGSIDGRLYQSTSGELRMSLSSDWRSEGEFEVTFALDETSPFSLPPGAPEPAAPAAAELTLVGTFESDWWVNCRSYISGFTGGHAVSDSPFCRALTF
jgi:hypothetical protein